MRFKASHGEEMKRNGYKLAREENDEKMNCFVGCRGLIEGFYSENDQSSSKAFF